LAQFCFQAQVGQLSAHDVRERLFSEDLVDPQHGRSEVDTALLEARLDPLLEYGAQR
jgi:hypothetical protein